MSTTRIEHDLIGEMDVPADLYYGIHTVRAVQNFAISGRSVSEVPEMVRGMVMVKKAAALTNKSLGVLPADLADAIVWGCDEVLDPGRCIDQFPVDVFQGGAGTSVNMNTNEVIANLALEHLGQPRGAYDVLNPNDHVNRSQSTNDAYPCGFRLALDEMLGGLRTSLSALQDSFAAKGEEFADIIKMGRTQLQDAVPMTLGQEFVAFAVTLGEEHRHLENARALLLELNFGATAIGTGLNTPPGYAALAVSTLSQVSGRPCVASPNLIGATSDTGAYVLAHAALKRLAVKLSKICNDLRLLSSGPRAGLNEINLPQIDTLGQKCVHGITANRDVCLGYVTNSIGVVTYLNDIIGHQQGDEIGEEAARTGQSVRDIVLQRGLMSEEALDAILSVENLLTPLAVHQLDDPRAAR